MNTGRAVAAGVIGTAAMTALLLIETSVGLPQIAIGQVLSTSLGLGSAYLSLGPALGWAAHFAVGPVLPVIFARWFRTRLPGPAVAQGLLYGALVFLLAQLVFLPLVGSGVFSHGDLELIAGSLVGHLVYGVVTVWI